MRFVMRAIAGVLQQRQLTYRTGGTGASVIAWIESLVGGAIEGLQGQLNPTHPNQAKTRVPGQWEARVWRTPGSPPVP